MATKSVNNELHNHMVRIAYCSDWLSQLNYDADGVVDHSEDDNRFSADANSHVAAFRLVRYANS